MLRDSFQSFEIFPKFDKTNFVHEWKIKDTLLTYIKWTNERTIVTYTLVTYTLKNYSKRTSWMWKSEYIKRKLSEKMMKKDFGHLYSSTRMKPNHWDATGTNHRLCGVVLIARHLIVVVVVVVVVVCGRTVSLISGGGVVSHQPITGWDGWTRGSWLDEVITCVGLTILSREGRKEGLRNGWMNGWRREG